MEKKYYNLDINDICYDLKSSINGLSNNEAKERLEKIGLNEISNDKKNNVILLFLSQFKDIMLFILFIAALISFFLKEYSDVIVILSVLLLNAVLGFIQEFKAEKALEALKKLNIPKVKVLRESSILELKSSEVVVGDIIFLEDGDIVCADARIIEYSNFKVDESSLTGESLPIEKNNITIDNITPLSEQKNMVFSGSLVVNGNAKVIVTSTGMNTEIGKIANKLKESKNELTPLQKRLANLSKWLSLIVVIIAFIIFGIGIYQGRDILEMVLISVSIAVAAIPEGLPAVVTIVLAISVIKLSKKNTIIRKLSSVETLGCTQVICSDKTGTLTKNKMTVKKIYLNKIYNEFDQIEYDKNIHFYNCLKLCNSVKIIDNELKGDPTEVALVEYHNSHINNSVIYNKIEEIPFDSVRKMMSVIYQINDKKVCYTKGALDYLLAKCSYIYDNNSIRLLTQKDKKLLLKEMEKMGNDALRVIGLAYKNVTVKNKYEEDLIFIGMVGMIDPPKEGVKEAINKCNHAGISTIMITGDHYSTASSIAKELNIIKNDDEILTGMELDNLSQEELVNNVFKYHVFCRVTPEHKVRIVEAYQKRGKIVAMSGDGVNDAPSLKRADIGVSMGINGTEVAKNASDMILSDDNFTTIVLAVEEGRKIYENITKAISYLLSCNLGEIITLFVATLLNFKILLPIHILWMNLVTDSLPALALGLDENNDNVMNELPRNANAGFFSGKRGINILYQGLLQGLLTLLSFFIGIYFYSLNIAETMAFTTIVFIQLFHSLNMRSSKSTAFETKQNVYLILTIILGIISQVCIIYIPVLANIFKVSKLSLYQWIISILLATLIVPFVELTKLYKRKIR